MFSYEEWATMPRVLGLVLCSHNDHTSISLLLLLFEFNLILTFFNHFMSTERHGGHICRCLARGRPTHRRYRLIPLLNFNPQDLLLLVVLFNLSIHGWCCVATSIEGHWFNVGRIRLAHFFSLHSLLKISNHFEDALLSEASRFFLPVPVRNFSTQINSHYLLYESPNYIEVFVVNGAHSDKVDVDEAEDVPPD